MPIANDRASPAPRKTNRPVYWHVNANGKRAVVIAHQDRARHRITVRPVAGGEQFLANFHHLFASEKLADRMMARAGLV